MNIIEDFEQIMGKGIAVLIFMVIVAAGAFAEEELYLDNTGTPSAIIGDAVRVMRHRIKLAVQVAEEKGEHAVSFKNNPEIQEVMLLLADRFEFTRGHLDQQVQVAIQEYQKEKEQAIRLRESEERINYLLSLGKQ